MINLDITDKITGNPQTMIIYGHPKVGKTTAAANLTLKRRFLLVDLEPLDGSDYVKARKVKIKEWAKQHNHEEKPAWQQFYLFLLDLKKTLKEKPDALEGIIIDNLSIIEDYAKDWALHDFNKSDIGRGMQAKRKKDGRAEITDIYNLPEGRGYGDVRSKFMEFKRLIEDLELMTLYIGHVQIKRKNTMIDAGETVSADYDELDLTGQLKRILTQHVSATGFLYRIKDKLKVSFKHSSDFFDIGCRVDHLIGYDEELDWDKIYIE